MSTGPDVGVVAGPHPRTSSPEELLFITTNNPSESCEAFRRKKARAHIMNRYHRKVRRFRTSTAPEQILDNEETQLEKAASIPSTIQQQVMGDIVSPTPHPLPIRLEQVSKPGVGKSSQETRDFDQNAIWASKKPPGPSQVGPFSSFQFPFPLNRRDEDLLFHYRTVFNHTNMPVNMKEEWLRFATADDALLHATLIISAFHVALLRGKTFSVDAFRHQTEVVKVLNDRLSDPILSALDSTILTISCLALIEILNASPLAAVAHIEALEQLIGRRGGLAKLGLNGTVMRKALWADLSNAIATQLVPRFARPPISVVELLPQSIQPTIDTSPATISAEISSIVSQSSGASDLCSIVYDLQYLSLIIDTADRTNVTEMDRLLLSDRFYDIERRAYDLVQPKKDLFRQDLLPSMTASDALSEISSALYAACCLAAITYSCLALREIPPQAGIFNQLVKNLAQVTRHIDISSAYSRYPKTLLWVLCTGGAAARGRKERAHYLKLSDELLNGRVHDGDAMRNEVQNSMHMTPVYLAELIEFWDEVEELQILRDIC